MIARTWVLEEAPSRVSYPAGRAVMNSCKLAARAAATISSMGTSSRLSKDGSAGPVNALGHEYVFFNFKGLYFHISKSLASKHALDPLWV